MEGILVVKLRLYMPFFQQCEVIHTSNEKTANHLNQTGKEFFACLTNELKRICMTCM